MKFKFNNFKSKKVNKLKFKFNIKNLLYFNSEKKKKHKFYIKFKF